MAQVGAAILYVCWARRGVKHAKSFLPNACHYASGVNDFGMICLCVLPNCIEDAMAAPDRYEFGKYELDLDF